MTPAKTGYNVTARQIIGFGGLVAFLAAAQTALTALIVTQL